MKTNRLLILTVCMFTMFLTACQQDPLEAHNRASRATEELKHLPLALEQMQAHRIEYVGDVSGVSKLLTFLPDSDENYIQNMCAIETEQQPYGLTIYYEPAGDSPVSQPMQVSPELKVYAEYLFECIDNLGIVAFVYRTSPSRNTLTVSEYDVLLKVERSIR